MLEQIWNGECITVEVVTYIMNATTGTKIENRGNILVRVVGTTRGGVPTVITKRNPTFERMERTHTCVRAKEPL